MNNKIKYKEGIFYCFYEQSNKYYSLYKIFTLSDDQCKKELYLNLSGVSKTKKI